MLVQDASKPITLTLDSESVTVQTLLQCYNADYGAFNSFVKDFARTVIFPRISYLVPSSTREGAEAFLKILRRQREVFEYSNAEMRKMNEVIAGFMKGKVSFSEAVDSALAAAQTMEEEVTPRDVQPVISVLRDVVLNQRIMERQDTQTSSYSAFAAKPAIVRSDVETDAKMLVLEDSEPLYGYSGLLRLSEHAYAERADFFFQPHFTEVIWGGQRIIFIFRHASAAFGFYYDIQLNELITIPSGGGSYETMTVILKNCVFLPIPSILFQYFTPSENEKKRFDVRYDILYSE
jgi:molecular chaperone HtpG